MRSFILKLKSLPRKHLVIFFVLLCGIIIGTVTALSIQSVLAESSIIIKETTDSSPENTEVKVESNPQPTTILENGCTQSGGNTICVDKSSNNEPNPTPQAVQNTQPQQATNNTQPAPCE